MIMFLFSLRIRLGVRSVAEQVYEKELFIHELMHSFMTADDLDDVIKSFWKDLGKQRHFIK